MTDLEQNLSLLGLERYLNVFQSEGFESWLQLMDVTEGDLEQMGVKLGHRRDFRVRTGEEPLHHASYARPVDPSRARPFESLSTESDALQASESTRSVNRQALSSKRRYRRHPKLDENAPERPPSAYVLFSNRVRERLKGQDLSFAELAKEVGRQWQDPDPAERAECEQQAQARKEAYYTAMTEYKRTENWAKYQAYLAEFKAKYGESSGQGAKRLRKGIDAGLSTRSSSPEATTVDGVRSPEQASDVSASRRSSVLVGSPDGTTQVSTTSRWRSGSGSPTVTRFDQRHGPASEAAPVEYIRGPGYTDRDTFRVGDRTRLPFDPAQPESSSARSYPGMLQTQNQPQEIQRSDEYRQPPPGPPPPAAGFQYDPLSRRLPMPFPSNPNHPPRDPPRR